MSCVFFRPHSIHPAVREEIREHILSFPRQPNHYSRMKGDVEREYLSPDLNLLRMYRLYKENNPTSTAKFWLYRDIFKQQNLCFGQPRSDTCGKCDALFSKLTAATTDGERLQLRVSFTIARLKKHTPSCRLTQSGPKPITTAM